MVQYSAMDRIAKSAQGSGEKKRRWSTHHCGVTKKPSRFRWPAHPAGHQPGLHWTAEKSRCTKRHGIQVSGPSSACLALCTARESSVHYTTAVSNSPVSLRLTRQVTSESLAVRTSSSASRCTFAHWVQSGRCAVRSCRPRQSRLPFFSGHGPRLLGSPTARCFLHAALASWSGAPPRAAAPCDAPKGLSVGSPPCMPWYDLTRPTA